MEKNKKGDKKNLENLKLVELKSSSMITLERQVTKVGEYLSKIEEDFPPKISHSKHFSVKIKLIIDDRDKNYNQI